MQVSIVEVEISDLKKSITGCKISLKLFIFLALDK